MNIARSRETGHLRPQSEPEGGVFNTGEIQAALGSLHETVVALEGTNEAQVGGRALELATQEALGEKVEGDADRGRKKLQGYLQRTSSAVVAGLEEHLG